MVNGRVTASANVAPFPLTAVMKKSGFYTLQTRAWMPAGNSGLSQVVVVSK